MQGRRYRARLHVHIDSFQTTSVIWSWSMYRQCLQKRIATSLVRKELRALKTSCDVAGHLSRSLQEMFSLPWAFQIRCGRTPLPTPSSRRDTVVMRCHLYMATPLIMAPSSRCASVDVDAPHGLLVSERDARPSVPVIWEWKERPGCGKMIVESGFASTWQTQSHAA
jgi:hypothetical protein